MKSNESILIFALALLGLFFLLRMIRDKAADLWHGLVCAAFVAAVYWLCGFFPVTIRPLFSELPFAVFHDNYLSFIDFRTVSSQAIYSQLLSMLALTFLVNITANFGPETKGIFGMLLRRLLWTLAAFFAHWLICRFLVPFVAGLLPDSLAEKLPMILVIGLGITFLLGFLKLLIGLSLTILNPVLGALFGFFFGHQLGKTLSRAIIATAALALLVLTLHRMGYSSLPAKPLMIP